MDAPSARHNLVHSTLSCFEDLLRICDDATSASSNVSSNESWSHAGEVEDGSLLARLRRDQDELSLLARRGSSPKM